MVDATLYYAKTGEIHSVISSPLKTTIDALLATLTGVSAYWGEKLDKFVYYLPGGVKTALADNGITLWVNGSRINFGLLNIDPTRDAGNPITVDSAAEIVMKGVKAQTKLIFPGFVKDYMNTVDNGELTWFPPFNGTSTPVDFTISASKLGLLWFSVRFKAI